MNQNIPQSPASNSKKMPPPIPRKKVEETPKIEAVPKAPSVFEDTENFLSDFSEEIILDLEKAQREPDNQKRKQKEIMLSIAAFTEGEKKIDVYNVLEQERKKAADTALLKKLETVGLKSLDEIGKIPHSQRAQWEADYQEALEPLRSLEQAEEHVIEAAKQTMFNTLDSEVRAAYISNALNKADIESLHDLIKSPEAKLSNAALLAEQNPKALIAYLEAMNLSEQSNWKALKSAAAWNIVANESKAEVITTRLEELGISAEQQKEFIARKAILEKPIDLVAIHETVTAFASESQMKSREIRFLTNQLNAIVAEGRDATTSPDRKKELAGAFQQLQNEKTVLEKKLNEINQRIDQELKKTEEYEIAGDKAIGEEQLLALVIEFPERAEKLLAREKKRESMRQEITKDKLSDLSKGSQFSPQLARLNENQAVVYKSKKRAIHAGEKLKIAQGGMPLRFGVRTAENHYGERIADLQSDMFDLDLVPAVVIDGGPEGIASRQEFVKGKTAKSFGPQLDQAAFIAEGKQKAINEGRPAQSGMNEGFVNYVVSYQGDLIKKMREKKFRSSIQKLSLKDALSLADDAHADNIMLDEQQNGEVVAHSIDNSNIYSDNLSEDTLFYPEAGKPRRDQFAGREPGTDVTKSFALEVLYDENDPSLRDIPQNMLDRLQTFKDSQRLQNIQRKIFHTYFGTERGEKKMQMLLTQNNNLLTFKRFPKSQSDVIG